MHMLTISGIILEVGTGVEAWHWWETCARRVFYMIPVKTFKKDTIYGKPSDILVPNQQICPFIKEKNGYNGAEPNIGFIYCILIKHWGKKIVKPRNSFFLRAISNYKKIMQS